MANEVIASKLATLMRMVAAENLRQRERIYSFDYSAGKWIWIRYKEYAGFEFTDVVRRDTRVNEANLTEAIKAMTAAIAEIT